MVVLPVDTGRKLNVHKTFTSCVYGVLVNYHDFVVVFYKYTLQNLQLRFSALVSYSKQSLFCLTPLFS